MGKVAAVVGAVVLGWAAVVGATTLEITNGSVFSNSLLHDTVYRFSGLGFSVQGLLDSALVTPGAPLSFNIYDLGASGVFATRVIVDGVGSCIPGLDHFLVCGVLQLITEPPVPPVGSSLASYDATALFTAVGHLNVGGGVDIVGQGAVHFQGCSPTVCNYPSATFMFGVPEPAGILLLALGLVVLLLGRHQMPGIPRRG